MFIMTAGVVMRAVVVIMFTGRVLASRATMSTITVLQITADVCKHVALKQLIRPRCIVVRRYLEFLVLMVMATVTIGKHPMFLAVFDFQR